MLAPEPAARAAAALGEFLDAVARQDFATAYEHLSAPLRARYTPARLEQDFALEPLAQERLVRAAQARAARPTVDGDRVVFPMGEGKGVQLVLEAGTYRVQALE